MDFDSKNTCLSLLLFLLFMCNKAHTSTEGDTISAFSGVTSLKDHQTITSQNGNFMMGLFTPGNYKYYIGIWYNYDRVSVRTVVWVANRDHPLSDRATAELTLLDNGNLVLYNNDPSRTSIWSTNSATSTSNTTEAVLGNDGNLVIRDKYRPGVVIWQSFDYPTDTWLPGGKIGLRKKTKESQLLTSWRNQENPATWIFSLELDPSGISRYLMKWNKSKLYLTSGEWNETAKAFDSVPEMRSNYIYKFSYISNEDETYFTYSLNDSSLSRFVMDVSGQIKHFTWSYATEKWDLMWSQPKQLCDIYGVCGAFGNCHQDTSKCECLTGFVGRFPWYLQDSSGGCYRSMPLQCGSRDVFSPIPTSNLPDDPQYRQVNSAKECKSACQSNCSCNAYAYVNDGCQLWEGDMLNIKQQSNHSDGRAGNLHLRLSDRTKDISVRKKKVAIWKIVVPVIVSLVATIMGVLGYMYLCDRNKADERGRLKRLQGVFTVLLKTKATYNDNPNTNIDRKPEGETHELLIFDLVCLVIATNNFCLENKLGEGGFGPVFKGKLQNGQQIAVKRLSKSSGQGIQEFKNEVVLISKLQHRNLVKLLGCCVQGEENMLIYEYMPNKSLDAFLFDPRRKAQLDWDKRFAIIGGIARGLLYLHRDSRLRVIHRDLKVSNILLDEHMIPKISDFGMARIFGGNQTIDNTNRVVGTIGYMSSEYMIGGTFSEKSDVFSFRVLVLEVVSGKRNNSFYNPEQPLNLLLHAWRLWNEGKWTEIVDEALGDQYSSFELMKCVHIGLLCVQNRAIDRPTMAEVDLMLSSETDRPSPKEPPYTFPASSSDTPCTPPVHCSNNNATLTTVEGR